MRKWICATLAVLCCLGGCVGTENHEESAMLTNVYEARTIPVPEEESILYCTGIRDGAVTVQTYSVSPDSADAAEDSGIYRSVLRSVPINGASAYESVAYERKIGAEEWISRQYFYRTDGIAYIERNRSSEDDVYSLIVEQDGETSKSCADLCGIFGTEHFLNVNDFVMDKQGYVYLADASQVYVLKPDMTYGFVVSSGSLIQTMELARDGKVYIWYMPLQGTGEFESVPIDMDAQTLDYESRIRVPDDGEVKGVFFGGECDYYYYTADGIYSCNIGDESGQLVMSFSNSNVPGGIERIYYAGKEAFLIRLYDSTTGAREYRIYTKAEDISLVDITVLEVASAKKLDNLHSGIAAFNANNKNIRVIFKDYSQYNQNPYDYTGSERLALDMASGVYQPDVLVGNMDEPAYKALIQNEMYADLFPLMEADETYDRDDLFDCVERTYATDGKLFAMPNGLYIDTLLTSRKSLPNQDTWSMEEVLDILENLPEGVMWRDRVNQEFAQNFFFPHGRYEPFVDAEKMECHFRSPLFIRYLKYVNTLPSQDDLPMNINIFSGKYDMAQNGEEIVERYTYDCLISFFEDGMYFGFDSTVHAGYPHIDGKGGGSVLSSYDTQLYTIMAKCENKEAAWQFVRDMTNHADDSCGLPLYRTAFRALVEKNRNGYVELRNDSPVSHIYSSDPSQNAIGIVIRVADRDWEEIENWINSVGEPAVDTVLNDEMTWGVIHDEISAYLAGNGTAEDAAARIDNRVKLYLAESK